MSTGNEPRIEARWLTVAEAAAYTRTDPEWILMHIRSGALRYVPTARRTKDSARGPRRRIIDRLKLDALMERLEVEDGRPAAPAPDAPGLPPALPVAPGRMSVRERLSRRP